MAIAAFACMSCGNEEKSVSLTGAGATFPLPYYNLAFKEYRDTTGVSVTYGGVGSGGGIRSLKDKVVDFAGSDAYLTDSETSSMGGEVIHIPTCMGAVVMVYNVPGVEKLNLSGEVVSDIYMGNVKKWNDSRIMELNPGVALPDMDIVPVYRSDGSGTTFVFTDYLSKVSEVWKSEMGTAKALEWKTGLAAKGNPGVAGVVSQTEGSVGYVGSEYAFSLKMPMASMRNKSGNFIVPDTESISAAATGEIPADLKVMITDPSAPDAYPISCFTWILLYREQAYNGRSEEVARATVDLVKWMLGEQAAQLTTAVHYAPVPESAVTLAMKALSTVTYNGKPLEKR